LGGKEGTRVWEEGVVKHPAYGMLRLALAEHYADAKKFGPALVQLEAALKAPPIDKTSFKDLAALRKHRRDNAGAAAVLNELAELERRSRCATAREIS
jgi:hypothetical protein